MQALIPSLEPMYEALCLLCKERDTWTGDIYAIRKALGEEIRTDHVRNKLTALQRRGMLTFSSTKERHKRIVWTVTLTQVSIRSLEVKKICAYCKDREACPGGAYCHICQQVVLALNAVRYVRSKPENRATTQN